MFSKEPLNGCRRVRDLSSVLATMVWSLWVNLGSSSLHGHPFSVPPSYLRPLPAHLSCD